MNQWKEKCITDCTLNLHSLNATWLLFDTFLRCMNFCCHISQLVILKKEESLICRCFGHQHANRKSRENRQNRDINYYAIDIPRIDSHDYRSSPHSSEVITLVLYSLCLHLPSLLAGSWWVYPLARHRISQNSCIPFEELLIITYLQA